MAQQNPLAIAPAPAPAAAPNNKNVRSTNFCVTVYADENGDIDTRPFNFVAANGVWQAPTEWTSAHKIRVVKYLAVQKEICPTTDRPHLQAVFQLSEACDWTTLKKAMNPRTHIEHMRGTIEQASAYCTKTETRAPNTEPFVVPCLSESRHWINDEITWDGDFPSTQGVWVTPL